MKKLETSVMKTKELLTIIRYETARKLEIKYEAAKRNPAFIIITVIILVVFIVVMLQEVPKWQVSEFEINNSIAVAQLENSYRATLAQIIGGFALLLGLYFTWRNVVTAKESQITELFTRAIDQLGNQNLEVRIGGIYALEKISIQSKKDHWPVMNILTAYIKKNSPFENKDAGLNNLYNDSKIFNFESPGSVSVDNLEVDNMKWAPLDAVNLYDKKPKQISVDNLDLQAILTVIGRRKYSSVNGEPHPLDMCYVDLQGADFFGANLESTSFVGTNLKNSTFLMANLKGAFLQYANLEGTFLKFANLKGSDLEDANLEGANLEDANLKGVNLKGANFEGANLVGVRNLSLDQLSKVKTLYKAKLDEKLLTLIKEKHPSLLLDQKENYTYNDTRWGKMNEI